MNRLLASTRLQSIVLILFVLAVGAAYGVQVNGNHGWSDDGSQYLRNALNLVQGRPYTEVNFEATANAGMLDKYPPGLPVILAVVTGLRGFDIASYRFIMVLCLVACVALLPRALKPHLGFWQAIAVTLCFAANPDIWAQVQHINSDFLCLFFILCFLITVQEGVPPDGTREPELWRVIAAGLLAFAAIATRTAAVALIPGCLFYCLFIARRGRTLALTVVVAAIACLVLLSVMLGPGGYFYSLKTYLSFNSVRRNLIQYPLGFGGFFGGAAKAPALAVLLLAALGALTTWSRKILLWDCVAFWYLVMLILWPFSDPLRFGLPVIPLFLAYLVLGIARLARGFKTPAPAIAWALALLLVAAAYGREYKARAAEPHQPGIFDPETKELWNFIAASTPPNSVIIFRKPRTLALLTNREGSRYSTLVKPQQMEAELCSVKPNFIIYAPTLFESDRVLTPAISDERFGLRRIFGNRFYEVYAVPPQACDSAGPPPRVTLPSRWSRSYPLP